MNNSSQPQKVKPGNRIVPFPAPAPLSEEERARLKAEIIGELVAGLVAPQMASAASQGAPDPVPLSLPSKKEKFDAEARRGLIKMLYTVLSDIAELKGAFLPPWFGKEKARIYFVEDSSYLYYSAYGQLYAGIKSPGNRKTCQAQIVLDTHLKGTEGA